MPISMRVVFSSALITNGRTDVSTDNTCVPKGSTGVTSWSVESVVTGVGILGVDAYCEAQRNRLTAIVADRGLHNHLRWVIGINRRGNTHNVLQNLLWVKRLHCTLRLLNLLHGRKGIQNFCLDVGIRYRCAQLPAEVTFQQAHKRRIKGVLRG